MGFEDKDYNSKNHPKEKVKNDEGHKVRPDIDRKEFVLQVGIFKVILFSYKEKNK